MNASTKLQVRETETEIDRWSLYGVDELKQMYVDRLRLTVENLRELAEIARVLEEKGVDISDLETGSGMFPLKYVRLVGHGQLLPDVVLRFMGHSALMRNIAAMPLPDQKRLADGGKVEVAVRRGSSFDCRMIDPLSMSPDQIRQTISGGRIHSYAEQIARLESEANPADDAAPTRTRALVSADARTGMLRVGNREVPIADTLRAIGDTAPVSDDVAGAGGSVAIDADLYDQVKRIAASRGVPVKQVVRLALINTYQEQNRDPGR